MSTLKAYLAEKYMSGPKADVILAKSAPQKKKKRKGKEMSGGMMIRDDDGGWTDERKEEEDELAEAVVEKDRGFKKRKVESQWVTIQEGVVVKEESPGPAADEEPVVVGGLLNRQDLKKMLPQNHKERYDMTEEEIARAQDTVYRDSSGKKIDTKAARAEATRMKREKEEREAKKMEWGKGIVQRSEAENRKMEMEKQKKTRFARHADDKELNEELKAKELWNDPASAFMSKNKKKGPRKPEYTGPVPPPNRFGIKPGYRWDGVDRSNGFEKKYYQTLNSKRRKGAESYQWSVDDM